MFTVKLKWNKQTFENVPLDTTKSVDAFKESIAKLTNVPTSRQKLMAKGSWPGVLKDDQDLSKITASEGMQIMLMGSADTVAQPTTEITFLEDLTISEQIKAGATVPCGMRNLGNTCYMNSTLQCLKAVSGVRNILDRSPNDLLRSLASLYQELDSNGTAIIPNGFVNNLRRLHRQFAEMSNGRYMQQDAEEFLNVMLNAMENSARDTAGNFPLGLTFEETVTCDESTEEPVIRNVTHSNKLICNIQGGAGSATNIDFMQDGIRIGLEETVEKFSPFLGRNATWKKTQKLVTLPDCVCVQFMRFFWKPTPESSDHAGLKCKILRGVSFPETFDAFEFCSAPLQQSLREGRDAQNDLGLSSNDKETGLFELFGVVTHKGRSADSGHYMAYVRQSNSNAWWLFDDDKVTETTTDEVLKLRGSGDRDMAYLCFYRRKILNVL